MSSAGSPAETTDEFATTCHMNKKTTKKHPEHFSIESLLAMFPWLLKMTRNLNIFIKNNENTEIFKTSQIWIKGFDTVMTWYILQVIKEKKKQQPLLTKQFVKKKKDYSKMLCTSILLKVGSYRTRSCENYSQCTSHHSIKTPATMNFVKILEKMFYFDKICNGNAAISANRATWGRKLVLLTFQKHYWHYWETLLRRWLFLIPVYFVPARLILL